jgi:hypothetical protein
MDTFDYDSAETQAHNDIVNELNKTIFNQKKRIIELEKSLNELSKIPVPPTVLEQIIQMEAMIRKLNNDVDYYKKHVPAQIIINRENKKKPTRSGGIPK